MYIYANDRIYVLKKRWCLCLNCLLVSLSILCFICRLLSAGIADLNLLYYIVAFNTFFSLDVKALLEDNNV